MKFFDKCFIFCILSVIMDNIIERKLLRSELLRDITEYCELNGIEVDEYVNQKLKSALMIDKYGTSPFERNSNVKLEKNEVPFVITPQEEADWGSKAGELKPLNPMEPDSDYIKEKSKNKPIKKDVNSELKASKSDDGKIIVNRRVLK